jgi:hypothetical protein
MMGAAALLQSWWAAAMKLASRAPELARALASGSWPAEGLAALAGLALLVAGARLGRILACGGGAVVGWLAGALVAPHLHGWLPATLPPWIGVAALGLGSLLAPALYPLALGLLPGLLLGFQMPIGDRAWAGALAGGVALALLAIWLRRFVLAATAAVAGAVLVSLALLAATRQVPALLPLARSPSVLALVGATLAVAGTAYQLGAGVQRRDGRGTKARPRKVEGVEDA